MGGGYPMGQGGGYPMGGMGVGNQMGGVFQSPGGAGSAPGMAMTPLTDVTPPPPSPHGFSTPQAIVPFTGTPMAVPFTGTPMAGGTAQSSQQGAGAPAHPTFKQQQLKAIADAPAVQTQPHPESSQAD
eukprot:3602257-Karenia_brevis.AAC.1